MKFRQEPRRAKADGAEETKRKTVERKYAARKKRRRHRRNRRAARKLRVDTKAKSRPEELVVKTFKVRALAFNGKNGIVHSEIILKVSQKPGCDVIGLRATRRYGQNRFTAAGYTVVCSRAEDSKYKRKGTHGVGLAVRESIVTGVDKGGLGVECISARLVKVRIQLEGKSKGVSFVVGYAPTLDSLVRGKHHFWNAVNSVVKGTPSGDPLFVLMDVNARTGKRQSGCAVSKVLGAYGRNGIER